MSIHSWLRRRRQRRWGRRELGLLGKFRILFCPLCIIEQVRP
jgi:hypothetical protein